MVLEELGGPGKSSLENFQTSSMPFRSYNKEVYEQHQTANMAPREVANLRPDQFYMSPQQTSSFTGDGGYSTSPEIGYQAGTEDSSSYGEGRMFYSQDRYQPPKSAYSAFATRRPSSPQNVRTGRSIEELNSSPIFASSPPFADNPSDVVMCQDEEEPRSSSSRPQQSTSSQLLDLDRPTPSSVWTGVQARQGLMAAVSPSSSSPVSQQRPSVITSESSAVKSRRRSQKSFSSESSDTSNQDISEDDKQKGGETTTTAGKKMETQHKWVSRPLVKECRICSSPATSVQHYGSVSCYSCRAFFRRTVGSNREYMKCSRGTDNCKVDAVNRTNCKKCRYQKCIQVGMRPDKVDRVVRKREAKKEMEKKMAANSPDSDSNSGKKLSDGEPTADVDTEDIKCDDTSYDEQSTKLSSEESAARNEEEAAVTQNVKLSNKDATAVQQALLLSRMDSKTAQGFQLPTKDLAAARQKAQLQEEEMGAITEMKVEAESPMTPGAPVPSSCSEDLINPSSIQDGENFENKCEDPVDFDALIDQMFAEDEGTEDDHPLQHQSPPAQHDGQPVSMDRDIIEIRMPAEINMLDLTFEEEFKIHELMARRDAIFSSFISVMKNLPRFVPSMLAFLTSLNSSTGYIVTHNICPIGFLPRFSMRAWEKFISMGRILNSDIVKKVDLSSRVKLLELTMPSLEVVQRGILHGNKDKGTFLDQHAAAGTLTKVFRDVLQSFSGIQNVRSFSPLNLDIFTSPWAVCKDDEDKFTNTINCIGAVIRDDVKLGTLYIFLVMLSPHQKYAEVHPEFISLRKRLSLLIYRYLKSRTRDQVSANRIMDLLLRLVDDVHECADIHRNRRIFRTLENTDIEELMKALDVASIQTGHDFN